MHASPPGIPGRYHQLADQIQQAKETLDELLKDESHEYKTSENETPESSEESREVYDRRKCRAELPFGHVKHNMNFRQFGLRGREGVQAEFSLLMGSFNLTRILNIPGIDCAMAFLRGDSRCQTSEN